MKSYYCTLDEARREFSTDSTDEPNERYIFSLIPPISERLATMGGFDFEPVYETRIFALGFDAFDRQPGVLAINDRLLELEALSIRGHALTVDSGISIDPTQYGRGTRFALTASGCRLATTSCSAIDRKRVEVTGWWGFRTRYAREGWRAVDQVKNEGGITAAAATLTVEAAQGMDADGFTPRFSPGQLLRIGDEMLRVGYFQVPSEEALNDLPVLRGQRGTEAADHAEGAPVYVWNMEEDVKRAAQRWVNLAYGRRGVHETVTISHLATVVMPSDAPQDVVNTMRRYRAGIVVP